MVGNTDAGRRLDGAGPVLQHGFVTVGSRSVARQCRLGLLPERPQDSEDGSWDSRSPSYKKKQQKETASIIFGVSIALQLR